MSMKETNEIVNLLHGALYQREYWVYFAMKCRKLYVTIKTSILQFWKSNILFLFCFFQVSEDRGKTVSQLVSFYFLQPLWFCLKRFGIAKVVCVLGVKDKINTS